MRPDSLKIICSKALYFVDRAIKRFILILHTEENEMTLGSKEHQEIMEAFESLKLGRLDREDNKETWKRGNVYQDGQVNELFKIYRHGYSRAKSVYQ